MALVVGSAATRSTGAATTDGRASVRSTGSDVVVGNAATRSTTTSGLPPITVRGSASVGTGASTGTTVSLPLAVAGGLVGADAQVGDVAVVVGNIGAGSTITMSGPVGSITRVTPQAQSTSFQIGVWEKPLTSADIAGGSLTVTASAGRQIAASIIVLSGAAFELASAVSSITTAASSVAIPQITPTNADDLLLAFTTGAPTVTTGVDVAFTPPAGWTKRTAGLTASTSFRDFTGIFTKLLTGGAGTSTAAASYTTDQTVKTMTVTLTYSPVAVAAPPNTGAQQGVWSFDFGGRPTVANIAWPLYLAHQGFGGDNPPETMPAFNQALSKGSQWLALDTDVWLNASGSIVMWHDTVMTDGTTSPEAVTDAAWPSYTVAWPGTAGVPNPARAAFWKTAADTWGGKRILHVELKGSSIVDTPLLNDIASRGLVDSTVVSCFTYPRAVAAAQAGFNALYALTVPNLNAGPNWSQIYADGIRHVAVNYTAVTSAQVSAAHAAGLKVWAFTLTTTADRDAMLAIGVDAIWADYSAIVPAVAVGGTLIGQRVTGSTTRSGSAGGTFRWSGTATGTTAHNGTAGGTFRWTGATTGTATRSGTASGTLRWSGTTTGTATRSGTAGGTFRWTGATSGTTTHRGTGSGAFAWTGTTVTGRTTRAGVGSGVFRWSAAAVTGTTTRTGTASSGTFRWTGATTGTTTRRGTAGGTFAWSATTVTGKATHSATGSGTFRWSAATVTGTRQSVGSRTGSFSWAGTAAGFAPVAGAKFGAAVGSFAFTKTATTGTRASSGSTTGAYAFRGTDGGTTTHTGTATGQVRFTTTTVTGSTLHGGAHTGSLTWTGLAAGTATRGGGTLAGTVTWTGHASGTATPLGSASGSATGRFDWSTNRFAGLPTPSDRTVRVDADNRVFTVDADDRAVVIPFDVRTVIA